MLINIVETHVGVVTKKIQCCIFFMTNKRQQGGLITEMLIYSKFQQPI